MKILQLNIKGRLILGFAVLCAVLAVVVSTTIVNVRSVNGTIDRTVTLRVPTAMAANDVVSNIYASLASLRGWLLTGNPSFKGERAAVWKDMDARGADMDRLAALWTIEANREEWKQAKPLLEGLHQAQNKAEAIAHTLDEQPANKILATEAAPLASAVLSSITAIINEESRISSVDTRKTLLIDFADFRGSMAMAVSAVRAYLLTADVNFRKEFEGLWTLNQAKFEALARRRGEMTPDQQAAFESLSGARAKFAVLPQKMFNIRASDRWNEAQWLLINEAIPRATKLLDIFAGTRGTDGLRAGGMVARQQDNLKKDAAAVQHEAGVLTSLLWALLGLGIGVAIAVVYFTNRSIVPPIHRMVQAMGSLAGGDHTASVTDTGRKDEIGLMTRAVLVFKENMIRAKQLAAEADESRQKMAHAERINQLTSRFDTDISAMLRLLAEASGELQQTALSMTATAEQTNRQATAVAAATEQASANVQTVAVATEELSSSVREIGRQASQSATIAQKAVAEAERTNMTVQSLSVAASRIGEVVKLISEIASQTNLLALNATIEAARAGDAGKGFTVVASEVKRLAEQTAKATEEIRSQIGAIQESSGEAVGAIKAIGGTITEINQIAASIASAVEQQSAATQEIARNVQEAATGTGEIATNITGVTQAAGNTGVAAEHVLAASSELSRQSDLMRGQVETFLANIKSA